MHLNTYLNTAASVSMDWRHPGHAQGTVAQLLVLDQATKEKKRKEKEDKVGGL